MLALCPVGSLLVNDGNSSLKPCNLCLAEERIIFSAKFDENGAHRGNSRNLYTS